MEVSRLDVLEDKKSFFAPCWRFPSRQEEARLGDDSIDRDGKRCQERSQEGPEVSLNRGVDKEIIKEGDALIKSYEKEIAGGKQRSVGILQ
jgi:hypothetical protein